MNLKHGNQPLYWFRHHIIGCNEEMSYIGLTKPASLLLDCKVAYYKYVFTLHICTIILLSTITLTLNIIMVHHKPNFHISIMTYQIQFNALIDDVHKLIIK